MLLVVSVEVLVLVFRMVSGAFWMLSASDHNPEPSGPGLALLHRGPALLGARSRSRSMPRSASSPSQRTCRKARLWIRG